MPFSAWAHSLLTSRYDNNFNEFHAETSMAMIWTNVMRRTLFLAITHLTSLIVVEPSIPCFMCSRAFDENDHGYSEKIGLCCTNHFSSLSHTQCCHLENTWKQISTLPMWPELHRWTAGAVAVPVPAPHSTWPFECPRHGTPNSDGSTS